MEFLRKSSNYRRFGRSIAFIAAAVAWSPSSVLSSEEIDYTVLSIEELMDIQVTSVSKKAQSLSDSAAAVFVITNKDLQRSGVTTIADALRMVPGLNVATIDSNKWAVTSRGFNGRFADKLLVLIDGRQVYTPTFSGVYWEVQDVMLDDVNRIEVIRGPGATLWGANAVNGVINIITKSAAQTQGGLVNVGGGNQERAFAEVRYGLALSDTSHVRLYGKYFDRAEYEFLDGADAGDDWHMMRSGFRLDAKRSGQDTITLHGDFYTGEFQQTLTLPMVTSPYLQIVDDAGDVSGGNLTAFWQRTLSADSSFSLQGYYDYTRRHEAFAKESRDSFDLDFHHRFAVGSRHDIVWGLGYHFTRDDFTLNDFSLNIDPDSRSDDLFSAFLQDEIMLVPGRLWLTLGAKFKHNNYSGYEVQPSVRLLWISYPDYTLWTAVSRAVRTPSRADADMLVVTTVIPPSVPANIFPVAITLNGNQDFDSEEVVTYEFGYRFFPVPSLSFDLVTYYNDYDDLRGIELDAVSMGNLPVYLEQPGQFANNVSGHAYGAELAAAWQVTEQNKLHLAYTYHYSEITDGSPRHQISLRSESNITANLDFDMWLRYVDAITVFAVDYDVDEYATLDARLAWRPTSGVELSLVGQNLFNSHQLQYVNESFTLPTEVSRSVYGKVSLTF